MMYDIKCQQSIRKFCHAVREKDNSYEKFIQFIMYSIYRNINVIFLWK